MSVGLVCVGASVLLDGDWFDTGLHVVEVEPSVQVVDLVGDQACDAALEPAAT